MKSNRLATGALAGTVAGLIVTAIGLRNPPYIAGLLFVATIVLAVTLALLACITRFIARTRPLALPLLCAAVCVSVAAYGSMVAADRFGLWDKWDVYFGPTVTADLVVLLRSNAGDRQIAQFTQSVLGSSRFASGTLIAEGHVKYWDAVPVGQHHGFALQFNPGTPPQYLDRLKQRLAREPLVWRVYEHIAPSRIVLPPSENVSPNQPLQPTAGRSDD